ncbi:ribose ABC transporter permease [Cysteiniphilum halobium]|uniref:ribose ABC transporter permease n=1 Tax=Cysteiniphilum halobium TaxID=2219059 RepID=UPI000E65595C|nr:ribose ABC transporter permease [Cysteiniphilum halobium]
MLKNRIVSKINKQFLIEYKAALALIIMIIIMSFLNQYFLTWSNILVILQQTSVNAVIAVGMTFVILTKGIDLSVGSVLALCGVVCAFLLQWMIPIYLVIPLTILTGVIFGSVSGIIVTKGGVQPFIATLITMTLFRGLTMVFSNGYPIATTSRSFAFIGTGSLLGVPFPVYIMAVVFAVSFYVLKYTRFGRYVYATGGNEEATKLAGIRVNHIKFAVYAISGALSAVAAMIITSRLSSAQPTAGTGYELDAIAAVVLGGTSLFGGKGKIMGTLMGALIIGLLSNALNLMDVSSYYQMIVKALVILIAVLFDFKVKN